MKGARNNLAKSVSNKSILLVDFIEEEAQCYTCECHSCLIGAQYREWISLGFYAGFLIPLLWIFNLSLHVYTQWHLNHEPTHPQIPLQDLPTGHEFQSRINASRIDLDKITIDEIDRINETTLALKDPHEADCPRYNLQDYRRQFLRQIACDIIESHQIRRAYYNKWTRWTIFGILGYSAVTTLGAVVARAYRPR